jgi:hypothetical protein
MDRCKRIKKECTTDTAQAEVDAKACNVKKDKCLAAFKDQKVKFDEAAKKSDQCDLDLDKAKEERKSLSKAGNDVCPGKIADFQKTMKESVS